MALTRSVLLIGVACITITSSYPTTTYPSGRWWIPARSTLPPGYQEYPQEQPQQTQYGQNVDQPLANNPNTEGQQDNRQSTDPTQRQTTRGPSHRPSSVDYGRPSTQHTEIQSENPQQLQDTEKPPLPIQRLPDQTEKPEEPQQETEPTPRPTEPTQRPTEPTQRPTEPTQRPTEPTQRPTEPTKRPTEPTHGPTEPTPTQHQNREDPTQPKSSTSEPTTTTAQPTRQTERPTEPQTNEPTRTTRQPTPRRQFHERILNYTSSDDEVPNMIIHDHINETEKDVDPLAEVESRLYILNDLQLQLEDMEKNEGDDFFIKLAFSKGLLDRAFNKMRNMRNKLADWEEDANRPHSRKRRTSYFVSSLRSNTLSSASLQVHLLKFRQQDFCEDNCMYNVSWYEVNNPSDVNTINVTWGGEGGIYTITGLRFNSYYMVTTCIMNQPEVLRVNDFYCNTRRARTRAENEQVSDVIDDMFRQLPFEGFDDQGAQSNQNNNNQNTNTNNNNQNTNTNNQNTNNNNQDTNNNNNQNTNNNNQDTNNNNNDDYWQWCPSDRCTCGCS